jgi:hypothetical protein
MKNTSLVLTAVLLSFLGLYLMASPQHVGQGHENPLLTATPATVSMRENDFALCGQAFYDDVYALTVQVFAAGAENVRLEDYQEQIFALVRSSEEFKDDPEAFVTHIKDIPGQLIEIILEDPEVLASCANFSVALVGPP